MTTNQTIDGVPREQVERALDAIEQVGLQDKFIDYTFVRTVKHELRALLDAPAVEVRDKCGVQMVDCPECSHQWDHFFECGNGPANPKPTGLSEGWNLTRKHDGYVVGHQSVAYPPDEKANERAERDGYVWVPFLVPAAKPQGELVAYRCRHSVTEPWFFSDKPGYWEWQALYAEQPASVAHTMKSVMKAICSIDGFPMLTSNQCHALAVSLNKK